MRFFKRSGSCLLLASCLLVGCDSGGIQPGIQPNTGKTGMEGMPPSNPDVNAIKHTAKTSGGMVNPPK